MGVSDHIRFTNKNSSNPLGNQCCYLNGLYRWSETNDIKECRCLKHSHTSTFIYNGLSTHFTKNPEFRKPIMGSWSDYGIFWSGCCGELISTIWAKYIKNSFQKKYYFLIVSRHFTKCRHFRYFLHHFIRLPEMFVWGNERQV